MSHTLPIFLRPDLAPETLSDEVYVVEGLTEEDYFDPDYLEGQEVRLISRNVWGTPVGYSPDANKATVCRLDETTAVYDEVPIRCLRKKEEK
jgi:hypothetical protein